MSEPYEYRSAGRSPLTVTSLAVIIGCLGYATATAAPPGTLIAWSVATGVLAWHILTNPEAGTRIDDHTWVTYRELRRRRIRRADIAHVEIGPAATSALTLVLQDGQRLRLSAACLPPRDTMITRLRALGIETRPV
jgi:hypothetical protein